MYQPRKKNESLEAHTARAIPVAALVLVAMLSLTTFTVAQDEDGSALRPSLTIGQLQGKWAAAIVGNTGCGFTTMYVTFTLNARGQGNGTATSQGHSSGCPDGTVTGLSFNILSFHPNGSGTANLTCGSGCGWNFLIQLDKDAHQFNLVDVDPLNPGNYLAGTAIHQ